METDTKPPLKDQLTDELDRQDKLRKLFKEAYDSNPTKTEEFGIEEGSNYDKDIDLRVTRSLWLAEHSPTQIIKGWSVMTGPRKMGNEIKAFVDDIEKNFPQKEDSIENSIKAGE